MLAPHGYGLLIGDETTSWPDFGGHPVKRLEITVAATAPYGSITVRLDLRRHLIHDWRVFSNESHFYTTTLTQRSCLDTDTVALARLVYAVEKREITGRMEEDVMRAVFWEACVVDLEGRRRLFDLHPATGQFYARSHWVGRACTQCHLAVGHVDESYNLLVPEDRDKIIVRRCVSCQHIEKAERAIILARP